MADDTDNIGPEERDTGPDYSPEISDKLGTATSWQNGFFGEEDFRLLLGDTRETLKRDVPDGVVDCAVTSPPYYNLRDYHMSGQIGNEHTADAYIDSLVEVFREVRRVLRDDGTLWLNISDTYQNGRTSESRFGPVKSKDMIGIPWMLAFALRSDGWYLRQDIVWCLSGKTDVYADVNGNVGPVKLEELVNIDPASVRLWNGESWTKVIGYGKSNDPSPRYRITTRGGEEIRATGSHVWPLADGTERRTDELKPGDMIAHSWLPGSPSGPGRVPEKFARAAEWRGGAWLGYMAGLYASIGCHNDIILDQDGYLRYRLEMEDDHASRILERMKAEMPPDSVVFGTFTIKVGNDDLFDFVKDFTEYREKTLRDGLSYGATVPSRNFWSLPEPWIKAYLEGWLDGREAFPGPDGMRSMETVWENELDWIRKAAGRIGTGVSAGPAAIRSSYKPEASALTHAPEIDVRIHLRVDLSSGAILKGEVVSVSRLEDCDDEFYDVSVDCPSHLFAIGGGLLTHNCKPNPMPESVTDRCTRAHEYIFLLSKSPSYYFDCEAIEEIANYDGRKDTQLKGSPKYASLDEESSLHPHTFAKAPHERWRFKSSIKFGGLKYPDSSSGAKATYSGKERCPRYKNLEYDGQAPHSMHKRRAEGLPDELYPVRRKRDVWTVPTEPSLYGHFALFPMKLIEPCVLAGSRRGGVVLDPFSGGGTTGIAAMKNGRKYIGCELNPDYVELTKQRYSEDDRVAQLDLF